MVHPTDKQDETIILDYLAHCNTKTDIEVAHATLAGRPHKVKDLLDL